MNLRTSAKGQECQVRCPGICNFDPATTVLCHYRLPGISGMGIKPPDVCAAFACSACHTAIDSGSANWTRKELDLMHLEGVVRTLKYWVDRGYLKW